MDFMAILVGLVAGLALGWFFFGSLWLSVRRLSSSPLPQLGLFVGFILRSAVTMLGIFLVMGGRWDRLGACLAGFLAARALLVRLLAPKHTRLNEG